MSLGAFLNARIGKLTASRMAEAMSFLKNGKPSAERENLMIELLAERLTGDAVTHYVNDLMRHGLEYEPMMKAVIAAETDYVLRPCETIDHPTIQNFASTPDSLVDDDAVFEGKCPQSKTHLKWMLTGGVPEQHQPQILAQLACTQRTRAVFASFDPRMPPHQRLYVVEWTPEPEEIFKVEAAAMLFLNQLDSLFDQLAEAA